MGNATSLDRANRGKITFGTGVPGVSTRGWIYLDESTGLLYVKSGSTWYVCGGSPSLDDAYNNDTGERIVTIDDGDLSWTLSGTNSFTVNLDDITGDADGFFIEDTDNSDYIRATMNNSESGVDWSADINSIAFEVASYVDMRGPEIYIGCYGGVTEAIEIGNATAMDLSISMTAGDTSSSGRLSLSSSGARLNADDSPITIDTWGSTGDDIYVRAYGTGATIHIGENSIANGTDNIEIIAEDSIALQDQYLSSSITLSQSGTTGLVGFSTATSIVAALNELMAGGGGGGETLQETYDAGTGTITLSGATGGDFVVNLNSDAAAGDAFEIYSSVGGADYLKLTATGTSAMTFLSVTSTFSAYTSGAMLLTSNSTLSLNDQWLSSAITLSELGNSSLSGFTATSIVGALNELASASLPTASAAGEMLYWSGSAWVAGAAANLYYSGSGQLHIGSRLVHAGDTDTYLAFSSNLMQFEVGNNAVLDLDTNEAVVNENGSAFVNFRVESTNHNNMLLVDAENEIVVIEAITAGNRAQAPLNISDHTWLLGSVIYNLDLTSSDYNTVAEIQDLGIAMSDDDTPMYSRTLGARWGSGSPTAWSVDFGEAAWTYSSGWQTDWSGLTKPGGVAMMWPLNRQGNWSCEISYTIGTVSAETSVCIVGLSPGGGGAGVMASSLAGTISQQYRAYGSHDVVSGDALDDDTYRFADDGTSIPSGSSFTLGLRIYNNVIQIYDDQSDAWENWSNGTNTGVGFNISDIAIVIYGASSSAATVTLTAGAS